jgi:hypothetical protein
MSKKWILMAALSALAVCPTLGKAEGLTAVKPVPGLACMLLDDHDLAVMDQSQLPPVRSAPSAAAQTIGYPTEIVFVKWPLQEQAGYAAMVRLNGQSGWIEADKLQPWHAMNGRPATCIPSLMSNGHLGTRIKQ